MPREDEGRAEAMYLQHEERQGLPANYQKLGEGPGTDPPSGLQKGPSPLTPGPDVWSAEL